MSRKKNTTFRKRLEAELAPQLARVSAPVRELILDMIVALSKAHGRGGVAEARRTLISLKPF
ncbi:MAG TPA: hypothetical protein VE821_14425 [Pyrinomonadaceae bacterium]|nr:hypothetical protein [Pyrinomonadaceae bacterium]